MKRILLSILMVGIVLLGACSASSVISVTAEELCSAYKDNEAAADAQYKGKILEVTGRRELTGSSGIDSDGNPYTIISSESLSGGVRCWFSPEDVLQITKLGLGKEVTIRGKCYGYSMWTVLLGECSIVD